MTRRPQRPRRTSPTELCLFDLDDHDIDAAARWCSTHHQAWPLYGRLYAWLTATGRTINPDDPFDRAGFRWLREAVASRIVTDALDDAGWTFDQLALDGPNTERKAAA